MTSHLEYEDAACQDDGDATREGRSCAVGPLSAEDQIDHRQEHLHCGGLQKHSRTLAS